MTEPAHSAEHEEEAAAVLTTTEEEPVPVFVPADPVVADHALPLLLDPQELGAEVSGALVAAELAVLPSGETTAALDGLGQSIDALNADISDALASAAAGLGGGSGSEKAPAGVGVTLDPSPWAIVHGSRGSEDNTAWRQPRGDPRQRYYLFSSQSVQEDEEANALYMGHLLMQNVDGSAARRQLQQEGAAKGEGGAKEGEGQGFFDEAAALIDFKVDDANAVSVITERVSDTETRLWTSTIGNVVVYRQVKGASGLQRLASLNHGRNTRFHGSYAFVASNGTENGFFTTMENRVARFVLRGSDRDGWRILKTGDIALPTLPSAKPAQPQGQEQQAGGGGGGSDHLVGLTLLDDGTIVAGSKHGVLMSVRLDAEGGFLLQDALRVADHTASGLPALVSNSLSSRGQGVFLVTHRELVRVDSDPATRRLSLAWAREYHDKDMPWYVGRLGAGSGSTPTVTDCGGRALVVITDGGLPMHLLWYDAATGQPVGRKVVQFGAKEDAQDPTTSEQSVAVAGCRAFVVQNYLGTDELDPGVTCASAPRAYSALRRRLGSYCEQRRDPANPADLFPVRACPVVLGCSAFGAALYELAPPAADNANATTTVTDEEWPWPAKRVWAREDVSCGTSIPLISTHDDSAIVYCAGLRKGSNQWALLGLDLATGRDRAHLQFYERNLALNALANPFYAGVEATGEDCVTVGAIGGVLHLSPESVTFVDARAAGADMDGKAVSGSGSSGGGRGFFLSESLGPDGAAASGSGKDAAAAAAAQRAGLRLIEDRTGTASSVSASLWGGRARQAAGALGQEALGGLVVLLGGLIILILMRWRRTGPWSPRMPR